MALGCRTVTCNYSNACERFFNVIFRLATESALTDIESMDSNETTNSQMTYIDSDLDPCMSGAQSDLNDDLDTCSQSDKNDDTVLSNGMATTMADIPGTHGMNTPGRDLPGLSAARLGGGGGHLMMLNV